MESNLYVLTARNAQGQVQRWVGKLAVLDGVLQVGRPPQLQPGPLQPERPGPQSPGAVRSQAFDATTWFVQNQLGVGTDTPTAGALIEAGKNMVEPTILVHNGGGAGGATFQMIDDASGANFKFKSTQFGGFKIRDHGAGIDVITIPGGTGRVGIGTTTPNEQLEITGNFRLPPSTATTGIIFSGANRFIHNFGTDNFFAGVNAGNLSMTGGFNTAVGVSALQSNTTGANNTAVGLSALSRNTTGVLNTAVGRDALLSNTEGYSNTAVGGNALFRNTTGGANTAVGERALGSNTTGGVNTAVGITALFNNTTGTSNTAIGFGADVSAGDLTNATAIGAGAVVNASNKVRIGNSSVTVIEGQVDWTFTSDRNRKENFLPIDGMATLEKLQQVPVTSWNYIGDDPKRRHYGPMAQDFFAAFGHDGLGTIGTDTTLTGSDVDGILMVSVQALYALSFEKEKQIEQLTQRLDQKDQEVAQLKARVEELEQKDQEVVQLKARVEELEQLVQELKEAMEK